jgi:hypothetical protein
MQDCLRELDRIEPELKQSIGQVCPWPIPEALFASVRGRIQDVEACVHAVNVDKIEPPAVVWLVISNAAGNALATGSFHALPGVLRGDGQPLLAVYSRAINELEKCGFYLGRDRSADADRKWIRDRIADAG